MGLISALKSLLGIGGGTDRGGEASVTVEHEPEAGAERAVTEPVGSASEGADEATEADEGADVDEAAEAGGSDESVEAITGIGPAYADRLAEAGIETVADLAAADAADVAGRTDLSEGRIEGWIEQARER